VLLKKKINLGLVSLESLGDSENSAGAWFTLMYNIITFISTWSKP